MTAPQKPVFTTALQSLEQILDQFQNGTPTLEEALHLFETGVAQIKICQTELSGVKGKVDMLVSDLNDINTTQIASLEEDTDD